MKLFSPYALWFLILIPILILMYILKQRYEERRVSSLYLWQQVIMDLDATSPFQRLKKNILFFLQLLILLLCIFALTNPFVWWKNNNYQNLVIVVDTSGSMSSIGEKDTKLEEAKDKAEALINSLSYKSKITLISTARNFKVEISGSTDKKGVLNKLKAIEPTNSAGNIKDTYSLVKAICDQYESYRVVYLTDNGVDLKGLNGEVIKLGPQRPNVSLDYIAQSRGNNGLKVLVRATNHSVDKSDVEICLYGEDKLISIKNDVLNAGETKTIYFDNVPETNKYIFAELTKEDGLLEDNKIYSIVKQKGAKKILLSTEQNVFLEKALSILKDIELFKTSPGEKVNDEFDLYIYDGDYQGELPQKGNILFVNPQKDNLFFKIGHELEGGKATIVTHAITKYMNNSDFVISKVKAIELPYWASPLIKVGEQNTAFSGEIKGQKIAVIGFDLHNSDFPLTPEFPIFVNNLMSYLIDRDTMSSTQYSCGDGIDITPLPEAEKLFIKSPDDTKIEVSSKYPISPFEKTYSTGIYEVSQKVGKEEMGKLVAVNFPISESSFDNIEVENSVVSSSDSNMGGVNLFNILLALALLVLTVEWVAYTRLHING